MTRPVIPRPSYPAIPQWIIERDLAHLAITDATGLSTYLAKILDKQAVDERANYAALEIAIAGISSQQVYDAVVDASRTTDDTTARLFARRVGAISFLKGLGYFHMAIAIRGSSTAVSDSTITEDTSVAAGGIISCSLEVVNGTEASGGTPVTWDLSGHAVNTGANTTIKNLLISNSGATIGTHASLLFNTGILFAENCVFVGTGLSGAGTTTRVLNDGTQANLVNCLLHNISPGAGYLSMIGGAIWSDTANNTMQAGFSLSMRCWQLTGCHFIGSGTIIWPAASTSPTAGSATLTIIGDLGDGWSLGSSPTISNHTFGAVCVTYIMGSARTGQNTGASITLTDPLNAYLSGQFVSITRTNVSNNGHVTINGTAFGSLDIAGPANLSLGIDGGTITAPVKLRGTNINANLQIRTGMGVGGLAVQGLGLTDSIVEVAAKLTGAAAGQQAYTEDGTSARNIVDIAGASGFPTASTVQATSTLRTEAGATPTGAAGGNLAGTYPNPTFSASAFAAVTADTKFGTSSANGTNLTGARSDHDHGSPAPTDQSANSSADLTLTNAFQDVTGATVTFTPSHAATKCMVVITADFDAGTTTDLMHATLVVDGTAEAEEAVAQGTGTQSRWTACQTYFKSLSAASHTLKVQAKQGGVAGGIVRNPNTRVQVIEFD